MYYQNFNCVLCGSCIILDIIVIGALVIYGILSIRRERRLLRSRQDSANLQFENKSTAHEQYVGIISQFSHR